MKRFLIISCFLATHQVAWGVTGLPDWRGGRMSAWAKGAHQIRQSVFADGAVTGRAKGSDPFWTVECHPFKPTVTQEVIFRGKSPVKGRGELYWAAVGAEGPTEKTKAVVHWIGDGDWHEYRVRPLWQGSGDIRFLRIDFPREADGKGEIGIADVRVVDEMKIEPISLAQAIGISFSCASKKTGTGEFAYSTTETPGLHRLRFTLTGDGVFHRYFLPFADSAPLRGGLVEPRFTDLDTGADLKVDAFRLCDDEPDVPVDLVTVGAHFATPACRVGTEGRIEVVLRNLGTASAEDVTLVVVETPKGVSCRPCASCRIGGDACEMLSVALAGTTAVEGTVVLSLRSAGREIRRLKVPVRILPSLGLAKSDYVPEPKPVKTDYDIGALYYPGWERPEAWRRVWRRCPERRPYLGWYDETNVEVVDWQIKWMVENGIGTMYVDWYWNKGYRHHEHWIRAFQRAKWRKYLKWAMMWANHNPAGSHSEKDQRAVTRYWIDHYFNTPEYLTRDGKPVVWIWDAAAFNRDLGKGGCKRMLDLSRRLAVEAGYKGIHFIAMKWPETQCDETVMRRYREWGFDEVGIYHFMGHGGKSESTRRYPYRIVADANPANWREQLKAGTLPFLPNLSTGWDDRPWKDHCEIYGKNATDFRRICAAAKRFADETGIRRLCLAPLNEWGEGSYAEPNLEHGFGFYEAVRDTFCEKPATGWPVNMVPADVGLGPYDLSFPLQKVTAWDFTDANRHGWKAVMGCSPVTCTGEGLVFDTTTRDPALQVAFEHLRTRDFKSIRVRMKAEGARGLACVYWARALDGMRESATACLPVIADGRFHDYVFEVAGQKTWKGGFGALRFDPCQNAGAKITIAAVEFVASSHFVEDRRE